MSVFFTADLHFCHGGHDGKSGIIFYCDRPFRHIDEMNQALIANWNKVVSEEDTVYLLGDIGFPKYENELTQILFSLNGKINWILGNHDYRRKEKMLKWKNATKRFNWIGDFKIITVNEQDIVLFHYPIYSWAGMHRGSWHLHGHTHGTFFVKDNKLLDVGVDCWDYTPVSYEQVKSFMDKRQFVPVDGHGKKGDYKCRLSGNISSK